MRQIKNIATDVIEWTSADDGEVKRCLPNATAGPDHDTLCGTDLDDPGTTNLEGAKVTELRARPTCGLCIGIAQDIVDRYL